jgi:hypothetical protein
MIVEDESRKQEKNAEKIALILKNVANACVQLYLENEIKNSEIYNYDFHEFFEDLYKHRYVINDLNLAFRTLDNNGVSSYAQNYPTSLHMFDLKTCLSIAYHVMNMRGNVGSLDTPGDLLNTLRFLRNQFDHSVFNKVDDSRFTELIAQLKAIISGLSLNEYERKKNVALLNEYVYKDVVQIAVVADEETINGDETTASIDKEDLIRSQLPPISKLYHQRPRLFKTIQDRMRKSGLIVFLLFTFILNAF